MGFMFEASCVRWMLGLCLQEAEATPVRPHMTPRPGQGLCFLLFFDWVIVFSVCTMHFILSLYTDLRQRHVAMATPGPGPMTPGATPHRTAPGGPPEKGLAGSPAETPQQMMRRNMNPYSPGPGSGLVNSYMCYSHVLTWISKWIL